MDETLKKMGMLLEKIAVKVDELDKRLKSLEGKVNYLEDEVLRLGGTSAGITPGVTTPSTGTASPFANSSPSPNNQPGAGTQSGTPSQTPPPSGIAGAGHFETSTGTQRSFSSAGFSSNPQPHTQSTGPSAAAVGGSSFLGSLLGSFAGMGLFNAIFNRDVSAEDVAKASGSEENETSDDLSKKLDELSAKIDQLESQVEEQNFEEDVDEMIDEVAEEGFNGDFDEGLDGDDDSDFGGDDW
ncbi:MAG: hypothetical protein ABGW77_04145 [Campylobacterales bacterium]|jgi:TolA-binding protein